MIKGASSSVIVWCVLAVVVLMAVCAKADLPDGGKNCTSSAQCNHGVCSIESGHTSGVCWCDDAYGDEDCSYKRKSKLVTFLLAFFVGGTGADRFYAGETGLGVGKLLLTVLPSVVLIPTIAILSCANACIDSDALHIIMILVNLLFGLLLLAAMLASGIWCFVDWILVVAGARHDGNGVSFKDDM